MTEKEYIAKLENDIAFLVGHIDRMIFDIPSPSKRELHVLSLRKRNIVFDFGGNIRPIK